MNSKTVLANAKINLFLDVTSKRDDGYHNIDSIMQTVSLFDEVTVSVYESNKGIIINQVFENSELPCDETNLCYKAAMAYLNAFNIQNAQIDITVNKQIPCEAGLAGGSADAAAVIKALDEIYKCADDINVLCGIGLTVGSDVPFCIVGGTCAVQGRGEIIQSLSPLPEYYMVLAKSSKDSVSTKTAYHRIDNTETSSPNIPFKKYTDAVNASNKPVIESGVYNVFQNVMTDSLDDTKKLISKIKNSGACATLMSGSGPSVFGLFYDKAKAEKAVKALKDEYFAVLCRPV